MAVNIRVTTMVDSGGSSKWDPMVKSMLEAWYTARVLLVATAVFKITPAELAGINLITFQHSSFISCGLFWLHDLLLSSSSSIITFCSLLSRFELIIAAWFEDLHCHV